MKLRVLLNAAPVEGGGGGSGTPAAPAGNQPAPSVSKDAMSVFDTKKPDAAPPPAATPSATPPPAATPTPAPTNVIQLSPEQMTEMVKAATAQVAPQAPQTPAQAPTQEDFDKMFHVHKFSNEDVAAILAGGEGALQALTRVRDGLVRQACVMSAYQMQDMEQRILAQLNPVAAHFQQQKEAELYKEFMTENTTLKDFEPVIKQVVAGMKAENLKFKDKKEAFKQVVERTTAFIRSLPNMASWSPTPAAPGTTPAQSTPQPAAMSDLSRGGQGGAGGSSTPAASKKPAGMAVFD